MIKESLVNAISSLSKKHQIHTSELRIRISKKEDSLKYEVMKNRDILEETNLATALNLNTITAFMVGNKLNTIIDSLSKNYQVSLSTINVRIYTKTEDCNPLLYLFDGVTPRIPLNLDDII